ncbi:methyltransferase domain-containing protein [Streptomyces sp. NPDC059909]|uniref:methyltransferase domain-containing protein n=1 Tax=Streptomyces sp. NPDC059909 TaxID=3346998 RepID=UPI00365A2E16
MTAVDSAVLEVKVKDLYRHVAEEPQRPYHFEMGRQLADRLGYPADLLDQVPVEAVESFAGVAYFFDLAALRPGEDVIDLGSGSGMDAFCASLQTGPMGRVISIDFTLEQLRKARRPVGLGLGTGPRRGPTDDADLRASCIGGAAQQDAYRHMIEDAGLKVLRVRQNPYAFLSSRARGASARYGVRSISLLAAKPGPWTTSSADRPPRRQP